MAHIRDGRILFFPPAEQDDRRRRRCSAIVFNPEKARAAMVSYMRRQRAPPPPRTRRAHAHLTASCRSNLTVQVQLVRMRAGVARGIRAHGTSLLSTRRPPASVGTSPHSLRLAVASPHDLSILSHFVHALVDLREQQQQPPEVPERPAGGWVVGSGQSADHRGGGDA